MDDITKTGLLMAIFIVCGILLMAAILVPFNVSKEKACKDLGFYKFSEDKMDGCEDYDGNVRLMQFDCTGFIFNVKCSAKQISVGGVFEIGN